MIARSRNHARCFLIWASITVLMIVTQALALDALLPARAALRHDGLHAQSFDQLLVALCSTVVIGCGAWWWLVSSLVVLDTARCRSGTFSRRCPAMLKRGLLLACGVAVAGSLATTGAHAGPAIDPGRGHPGAEAEPLPGGEVQRGAIAGLPLPERVGVGAGVTSQRPPQPGPRLPLRAVRRAPTSEGFVIVRPGDNLWEIAARALGADADVPMIDTFWRELYQLNRHAIGPDPDLIHPGLRLRLPGAGQE